MKEIEIVKNMQKVVGQMRLDDIEENPACLEEIFTCAACGKDKDMAGSIEYPNHNRLCNDCVLIVETAFALNKFVSVQELIDAMEDKRLEELCEFIKIDEQSSKN